MRMKSIDNLFARIKEEVKGMANGVSNNAREVDNVNKSADAPYTQFCEASYSGKGDNNFSKIIKSIGKKLIIPLTLTTFALTTLLSKDAGAVNWKKLWNQTKERTSIEASYSYGKPDLNKEYLDEKINKGYEAATNLEPAWKPIKPADNLQMLRIGAKVRVYENNRKKIKVNALGGWESGKTKSAYNESYTSTWPTYNPPLKLKEVFSREEEIKITKPYVGIEISKELSDKVNVSGMVNADFYKVNGNANFTWSRPEMNYTQWRRSESEGNATGFSGEVDLTYKLGKNVSLGAGVGYTNAKVSTSGREACTETSNPGWYWYKDYGPKFVINNIYFNGLVKIKF